MGILNRTPDSFYDKGATFALDDLVRRAGLLVDQGADLLDVGGVKAGPGPEVGEAEELDRVVPAIEALAARFDVALSVDTWRAPVARGGLPGRRRGRQRHQRLRRPGLPAGRGRGRSHGGGHPHPAGPADPRPRAASTTTWSTRCRPTWSSAPGRPGRRDDRPTGSSSTPASTWARRPTQSLALLRASDRLADLGYPLLLSASNKTFLGVVLGLEIGQRREASLAASALGAALGCRVMRVHEVGAHRQVVRRHGRAIDRAARATT